MPKNTVMEAFDLESKEYIKVYIDFKDGKASCICKRSRKGCGKQCTPEVVERNRYRDWEKTFPQDRYGKAYKNFDD